MSVTNPSTRTALVFLTWSQGINCQRASETGLLHQIHQQIITSHATFTIREQRNGSFKAVFSQNGSPMALSYGSMANVRPSHSSQIVQSTDRRLRS